MKEVFLFAHLMIEKKERLMNVKKVSVLLVDNILRLKAWRLTTLRHGVKAEKLLPKTAKCFAKIAIGEKVGFELLAK